MKKTLLVLISIIAALALVGCKAETPAPGTGDSTTAHSGAEVINRSIALLQEFNESTELNTLSVTTDHIVAEGNSNEALTVGDVIRGNSEASVKYDGDTKEVTASTSIAVTIDGVDYIINGDITYSVDESSNLSGVVSKSVSIKDANEKEATITDSELVSTMEPFKDLIAHLIESWVADFVVPNWVSTGSYIGQDNPTEIDFMNGANLIIDNDNFSISFKYSGLPINISTSGDVVLKQCKDLGSTWELELNNITVIPETIIVDATVSITMDGGNINVDVNVVTMGLSIPDIKFVPQG